MSHSSIGLPSSNFDFEVCKLKLGSGGSGSVFLAQHRQTKELVAVKRLFWSPAVEIPKASFPQRRPSSEPQTPNREQAHIRMSSLSVSEEHQRCASRDCSPQYRYAQQQAYNSMEGLALGDRPLNVPLKHTSCPARPTCESTILHFLGPHQHIVKFLGNYTAPNRVTYLAMELMDSDLGREIRAHNTSLMNEDVTKCLLHGVVSAIDHLHRRGIAHCDIKPSNVLLKRVSASVTLGTGNGHFSTLTPSATGHRRSSGDSNGERVQVFLGDFSSAHFTHEGKRRNGAGGTLYYKSPEQLMGHAVDLYACDMWALGCTIFELITGTVAFCGSTDLQVLHQIHAKLGTDFYNFPSRVRESTLFDRLSSPSPDLLLLLKGLLALDPQERLSAKELLQQSFFNPAQQILDWGRMDLAIPLQLRCGRSVDASQFTFRSIVGTPPIKRSKDATADANVSSSAHHCSVWSLSSISATQSPTTLRRQNPHVYDDVPRRHCSLFSLNGARGSGGNAHGKEDTPSTIGKATSLDNTNFTPLASVKRHGTSGFAEASCSKPPQLQPTGNVTIGNLRTSMIFERGCGAVHERRALFSDEGESPSWMVRKNLFESPSSLKRPHPDDSSEKNLRELLEYEAITSNCSTPRTVLAMQDAAVPLKELFHSLPEA